MIIRRMSFREKLSSFRDTVVLLITMLLIVLGGLIITLFQDIYVGICYILGFSLRRRFKQDWLDFIPLYMWSAALSVFLIVSLVAGIFWRPVFYLASTGILMASIGSFPKVNYSYRRKKQQLSPQIK
jgi:hypothetical protein